MASRSSSTEKQSRPGLDTPHHPDKDCNSNALIDSIPALSVSGTFSGQEQQNGEMSGSTGPCSGSANENKEMVITAIRVTDVALGLGGPFTEFYAVLRHNGHEWRTEKKGVSVNGGVEWTGPIPLQSDLSATIYFEIYATSEFQPTLGDGEQLRSVAVTVEQLLDHSEKAMAFRFFPDGDVASPSSSILITVRKCEDNDSSAPRWLGPQQSIPESRGEIGGTIHQSHSAPEQSDDQSSGMQDSARSFINGDPWDLSASLLEQFGRSGDLADLQQAITILEGSTRSTPIKDNGYCMALGNLGVALSYRFVRLGELVDLEDAISNLKEVIDLTPHGHPDEPRRLDNLGHFYQIRFERLGQLRDLEDAILRKREAIDLVPNGHPDMATYLNNLGSAYQARFENLGEPSDLEDAISRLGKAVELTPHDHPGEPHCLNNLGNCYRSRFQHHGQLGDLEDAVSILRKAVDLTPPGHPEKPRHLDNLGNCYQTRFHRFGRLCDLEGAILRQREAVELTPLNHPDKPRYLNNLGHSYQVRFVWLGKSSDLEDAISILMEAVALTPHGHPEKSCRLDNLGFSHKTRFEHLGALEDLEDAISNLREAIALTPHSHPEKPGYLNNLGISYYVRFQRLAQHSDLQDAISNLTEAVDLTPRGHPDKPLRLDNLGISYRARFERFWQLDDLEDAISRLREAVNLTPHDHPNRPRHLSNLGISYHSRFMCLGQLSDLEDTLSSLREVVDLTPHGHTDKPARLSNLSTCYKTRFDRLGQFSDLDNSILSMKEAVDLTPHGHPDMPLRLSNLGAPYHTRFEHLGQLSDLEDAILAKRQAVKLTSHGHPDKPRRLSNLGNSYQARFERLGQLNDLEDAISRQSDAVELTPLSDPYMPCRLNNLGICYQIRFERLRELDDLGDAILRLKEAVGLTPYGHRERPGHLSNLGVSYITRFESLGERRDLEDAISSLKEAADLTPPDHPDKPRCLNNLGHSYQARFERLKDLSDLEDAISSLRKAVDLTPRDHPEKSRRLSNLAKSYRTRFELYQKQSDLKHTISIYAYAASTPVSPVNVRLSVATAWISFARRNRHRSLLRAYSIAITLVPQLAWIGLSLSHRYDQLSRATDLVREAAAEALEEGFPEMAVEWLEQGRSIIWNELFQLRSSYEELSSVHPDHARRLRKLSTQLDQTSATHEQSLSAQNQVVTHRMPESLQQVADRHRALAIERDNLLQEIRRLPGFEQFLRRKKFSQLRASAHSGPVVILNVAETRCDALIIVANLDHVIHVPLPGLTSEGSIDLQDAMNQFVRHARVGYYKEAESPARPLGVSLKSILSRLWEHVVRPVLEILAFSVVPEDLSRIFWCPTGPLAFLPIHAAGLYDDSTPGHKVFDFVVSSYAPTLAILAPSPNPIVPASKDLRMLVVRQPSSDGRPRLPGVADELAHIKNAIENSPSAQTIFVESHVGTVEEVLALMKETDWVHFACHGAQDGVDSGLCLADRRRLKLRDIVALSRPRGGLAFLSACQTATGEKNLSDEAIHMAAGMLFAGYEGVIGTMWSISDKLAPRVARDVYGQLFKKGTRPDYREAARALHDAMKGLRDARVPFTEWIPFVHVGL